MNDQVTSLLHDMQHGDSGAVDRLVPIVYRELRRIAAGLMRRERGTTPCSRPPSSTRRCCASWKGNRSASRTARTSSRLPRASCAGCLVDHARRRIADKRGGEGLQQVELEDGLVLTLEQSSDVLALHDALDQLERLDERQARIVEMHYFAGNSVDEIAVVVGVSDRTVKRELQTARLFLRQELQPLGTIVV